MTLSWRGIPFAPIALAICLLFAAVGAMTAGDFGPSLALLAQRDVARANLAYALGDEEALPTDHNRFYGVAFELPLLLAERLFGLEDGRSILRMRHMAAHLFFLAGAFFCGALAQRMFGSRTLGLVALLLFALHPRLYAHSFFNSKDPAFAAMFVIALYSAHRAFARGGAGAFALCGVCAGLAINLRVFGLLLAAAVLAMLLLDLAAAPPGARRRMLAAGGAFAAATLATVYAAHPYYWADPSRFLDGMATLARHPSKVFNLFQGRTFLPDELPLRYLPTWFAITVPPFALLAGIAGAAWTCRDALRAPRALLRRGGTRFRLALLGCVALPLVAVLAGAHTYNAWRHFHFVWGPFSLLATFGLCRLAAGAPARAARGARPTQERARRLTVGGLAFGGLVATGGAIAALHPHQHVYFGPLTDRATPDALAKRYVMDFSRVATRSTLEHLLARFPSETLRVARVHRVHKATLPRAMDQRVRLTRRELAARGEFEFLMRRPAPRPPPAGVLHESRAYGSAYFGALAPRLAWGGSPWYDADAYRQAYRDLLESGPPAARAAFDVHLRGGFVTFAREPCVAADVEPGFLLHVVPANPESLRESRRAAGFEALAFSFHLSGGVMFDGKCMLRLRLPDYPAESLRAGQFEPETPSRPLWLVEFPVDQAALAERIDAALRGVLGRPPAATGRFDAYLGEVG